jgi:hypothetical protein
MDKEFCTYNQALALKELGFDEPCLLSLSWINGYNTYTEKSNEPKAWISSNVEIKYDFSQFKVDFKDVYHVEIQIPLYQQVFRWFREKYGYLPNIHNFDGNFKATLSGSWFNWSGSWKKTYEEAESACLDKLIEIVKNK